MMTTAAEALPASLIKRQTAFVSSVPDSTSLEPTNAEAHEVAADALLHHAREVERVQLVIASIEHRAHRLLESAAHGVAELAGFARHFVPPPPGNHAWLDVDLPHLPHLPRPR